MAWEPVYVTADELAAYMRIENDLDDAELALAAEAASRAVDSHCGRQFGQTDTAEERRFTVSWEPRGQRWTANVDDLASTEGLAVESATGVISDYELSPLNAAAHGRPWTRIAVDYSALNAPGWDGRTLTVTGTWGWPSVPLAVKLATRLQGSRFHIRRGSPYGVAGSPDLGNELRLLSKVDADVAVMLRRYVRRPVVA